MAALPFVAAPGLSARPIRSTATSRAPGHSVPAATQRREAHRKNGFVAAAPLLLAGAAAKKCTRRATAREPQVLPFVEPSSGREVVLIASVHFNPRSVQKATEVTRKLAEKKELGAVVLETCKTRWRRVEETQKPGSPLRSILDNEMQAAAEIAEERSIDVVLGDQRIEDLTRDITTAGRAAIDDMLSPLEGWQRTGAALVSGMANLANLRKRKAEASAGSEEALGLADFADPELIFGFVVAVPRYVLSTALKAPTLLAGVLAFYLACAVLPSGILGDLIMIAAEAVLFRVILQVLLRDRDLILAENIKKVCQKKDSGSVVAVLGAAHCNGVRRLLLEGLPEKQLSDDVKDTEEESGIFWSLVEIVIKFKHFKPTSGTPKRAVMAEYSPVGLAIIAVIMACVVLLNGYFWKRFVDAEEVRQHLQDGTCEIVSPSHYSSGWKAGWEFPIIGPSWTDVPCSLKLKVKGDEGIVGKTSLHFTYWQGIVWDYVQDSCSKLIPTKADKPFDCAYLLGEHGGLSRAYVGNVRDLPRLPLLFLMKACGLSALTLGPFLPQTRLFEAGLPTSADMHWNGSGRIPCVREPSSAAAETLGASAAFQCIARIFGGFLGLAFRLLGELLVNVPAGTFFPPTISKFRHGLPEAGVLAFSVGCICTTGENTAYAIAVSDQSLLEGYENFRKVDSLQLHAPFDHKERHLAETRSKCLETGRREEQLAKRLRQFLNVLVGISVGIAAVLVRYGCELLGGRRREAFLHLLEGKRSWDWEFAGAVSVAMGTTACFALLATVCVLLVPQSSGSGIPGVLAFLNGVDLQSSLRGPVLVAKALGTVLSVGGGLAVGPEGPMVHIGAIVGMLVCRRMVAPALRRFGPLSRRVEDELSRQPLRYHVQAAVMGAGAGIAAAFNAPKPQRLQKEKGRWQELFLPGPRAALDCVSLINLVPATCQVVEEDALRTRSTRLLHSFISCAFAVLTSNGLSDLMGLPGESIYERTAACLRKSSWQSWVRYSWMPVHVAVVGVLCGLLAILFNRLVVKLSVHFMLEAQRLGRGRALFLRRFVFSLLVGACCGAFAICLPHSQPCTESSLQNAFHGSSGCILEDWLHQLVTGSRTVNSSQINPEVRDDNPMNRTMSYVPHPGLFGIQYDPLSCPDAILINPNCSVNDIEQMVHPKRPNEYCCGFRTTLELKAGKFFNSTRPWAPLNMGQNWPAGSCDSLNWNEENKIFMNYYSPGAALTLVSPTHVVRNLLVRGAPMVLPLSTVLLFLVFFFVLAACSATAWMPGGLLVPMMCIGAAAGRLYGMCWHWMLGLTTGAGVWPPPAIPWIPEIQQLLAARSALLFATVGRFRGTAAKSTDQDFWHPKSATVDVESRAELKSTGLSLPCLDGCRSLLVVVSAREGDAVRAKIEDCQSRRCCNLRFFRFGGCAAFLSGSAVQLIELSPLPEAIEPAAAPAAALGQEDAEAVFHDSASTSIPEARESSAAARGAWQMEVSPGLWETVSSDVNMTLTEACHAGQLMVLYSVRGARPSEDASYDVDFRTLLQTNRKTGKAQQLRWDQTALAPGSQVAVGAGAHDKARTRYQWELRDGLWADFEEEEEQYIVRAWMHGQDFIRYEAWGLEYEINFPRMVQINLSTGNKRHIRVKPVGTHYAEVPRSLAGRDEPEKPKEPENLRKEEATAKAKTEPRQAHSTARSAPEKKRFSLGKKPGDPSERKEEPRGGPGEPRARPTGDRETQAPQAPREDFELPAGASWPALPAAREEAGVLFQRLCNTRQLATAEKRSHYKAQCLAWHPDKNLDKQEVATEVFKFLQLVRDWYLSSCKRQYLLMVATEGRVLVLLLEVSLEPFMIPVILISVLAARSTTSLLKSHGLYHELMNVQSLPFLAESAHWRQGHYTVEALLWEEARTQRQVANAPSAGGSEQLRTFTRDADDNPEVREFPEIISISRTATENEITEVVQKRLPGDETTLVNGFPVTGPAGQLCGLVTREALMGLLAQNHHSASTESSQRPRSGSSIRDSALPLALPPAPANTVLGVEDVMDSAPFVLQASTPIVHAHMLFARCGLRHVVVVDSGHRPIGVLTRKSLMPWRTPWLDESNLHHDTFLEQRAAHSPTASAIASRNNSPPNTPPLSRQGSWRLSGGLAGSNPTRLEHHQRIRDESALSPLVESLRLTSLDATPTTGAEPGEGEEGTHEFTIEGA
ncbi:CLC-B [Symbiodinium sp. KB8]|nr:CLC-B [Symbiodinium sp. KB8]